MQNMSKYSALISSATAEAAAESAALSVGTGGTGGLKEDKRSQHKRLLDMLLTRKPIGSISELGEKMAGYLQYEMMIACAINDWLQS